MATEWRKAPDYVLDITKRLIGLYHEPLKDARIGVIMRSEAPVTGGRVVLGKAKRVPAKAQVYVPYDFIIWLSADRFPLLAPLQKRRLSTTNSVIVSGMKVKPLFARMILRSSPKFWNGTATGGRRPIWWQKPRSRRNCSRVPAAQ